MKRSVNIVLILLVSVILLSGCATAGRVDQDDYSVLCSAVSACSYAMIGEYGDSIPHDLTVGDLLSVCEKNTPKNYFAELRKYPLEVKPMGTHYLLLVYDTEDGALVMFDYSCTPACDGKVMLEPDKYDIHKIESYDPCKDAR